MLRAAFLGCSLVLPALFASYIAGRLNFGAENTITDNAQVQLGHHDYRLVCYGISRSISSASQVFYPGAVFSPFAELFPIA